MALHPRTVKTQLANSRESPSRWLENTRRFLKGLALFQRRPPLRASRGAWELKEEKPAGLRGQGRAGQTRRGSRAPPAPLRAVRGKAWGAPEGTRRCTRPGPALGAGRHLRPLTCKSRALGGRPPLRGCRSLRPPAAGAAGTSPSGCAGAAPPSAILWRRWREPGGAGPAPQERPPWQREGLCRARRAGPGPAGGEGRPRWSEPYGACALQRTKPSAFIPGELRSLSVSTQSPACWLMLLSLQVQF